jgi:chaperonin cofactor prefoldin
MSADEPVPATVEERVEFLELEVEEHDRLLAEIRQRLSALEEEARLVLGDDGPATDEP